MEFGGDDKSIRKSLSDVPFLVATQRLSPPSLFLLATTAHELYLKKEGAPSRSRFLPSSSSTDLSLAPLYLP